LRAIASQAGLMLGSLTYRYPTKDSLVLALMRRSVARVSADVTLALAECHDPTQRLRQALRAHVSAVVSDDAIYVLLFDWRRLPPDTQRALERELGGYESMWDALILDASAAGQIAPGLDLRLVRRFVFGAANSVAFWYPQGESRSPAELADAFSAFIGLGTLAPEHRPDLPAIAYARLSATAAVGSTTGKADRK
jgi:AcrR family transcriptional regulator